jgi:hypothetical protein
MIKSINNSNMYSIPSDGFVFPHFEDMSHNKGLCKTKLFGSPDVVHHTHLGYVNDYPG